jgi:hypothetical protein
MGKDAKGTENGEQKASKGAKGANGISKKGVEVAKIKTSAVAPSERKNRAQDSETREDRQPKDPVIRMTEEPESPCCIPEVNTPSSSNISGSPHRADENGQNKNEKEKETMSEVIQGKKLIHEISSLKKEDVG